MLSAPHLTSSLHRISRCNHFFWFEKCPKITKGMWNLFIIVHLWVIEEKYLFLFFICSSSQTSIHSWTHHDAAVDHGKTAAKYWLTFGNMDLMLALLAVQFDVAVVPPVLNSHWLYWVRGRNRSKQQNSVTNMEVELFDHFLRGRKNCYHWITSTPCDQSPCEREGSKTRTGLYWSIKTRQGHTLRD